MFMIYRTFKTTLLASLLFFLASCANNPELMETATKLAQQAGISSSGPLSVTEISAGLKEALRVGSENVVQKVGAADGYNNDPKIHIPLPASLVKARNIAAKVGLQGKFDDLETKLNQAAEAAAPKAKKLFWSSISEMSVDDAKGILSGPDNSATQFFRGKMTAPLSNEMRPIVDQSMSQAGVIQAYDSAMSKLGPLAPSLPDYKTQLTDHVLKGGMDGIFHYLSEEEAAIRNDPSKRVSDLLKRVFGNKN
jgi:hypothetical protein